MTKDHNILHVLHVKEVYVPFQLDYYQTPVPEGGNSIPFEIQVLRDANGDLYRVAMGPTLERVLKYHYQAPLVQRLEDQHDVLSAQIVKLITAGDNLALRVIDLAAFNAKGFWSKLWTILTKDRI